MKLSKNYSYEVLCEDAQTRCFLYAFLKSQGICRHKIYVDMAPAGSVCGSQYVRQKYPEKVRYYCSRNYRNIVIIVCADADNLSVGERIRFIEDNDESIDFDRQQELIVIWVPRKQIENWMYFWRSGADEEKEFRHTGNPERCSEEAQMMSDYLSGQMIKDGVLPSIDYARKEFERICFIQKSNDM